MLFQFAMYVSLLLSMALGARVSRELRRRPSLQLAASGYATSEPFLQAEPRAAPRHAAVASVQQGQPVGPPVGWPPELAEVVGAPLERG